MSNVAPPNLDRSLRRTLWSEESGELLHLTRQDLGWEWMSFFVRRLAPGQVWEARNTEEESVVLLLGGTCLADWGEGRQRIGQRKNVFGGLPHAVYLPAGSLVRLEAETACELAACSVPSSAQLKPRLVTPTDVTVNLRGGGNASRQIVNVLGPDFPADKLMVVECIPRAATGRATLPTSTTYTIPLTKWTSMKSITIAWIMRAATPTIVSTPRTANET